ncbi:MAG: hypothetical protein QM759_02875 [Terricaulis sp.]
MKNQKKTEPRVPLDEIAEHAADGGAENFDTELYDPQDADNLDLRRAMPGVIRRAHIDAARRS